MEGIELLAISCIPTVKWVRFCLLSLHKNKFIFGGLQERRRDPRWVSDQIRWADFEVADQTLVQETGGRGRVTGRVITTTTTQPTPTILPSYFISCYQLNGRLLTVNMAPKFKDGEVVASVSFVLAFLASHGWSLHVAVQWQMDFVDTHNRRILYALYIPLLHEWLPNICSGAFVGALVVGRSG
jgi:hypothetical protein